MTRVDPNNSTIFNNTLRNDVSSREINAKFRNDMITMESAGKHGKRQWEWCGGVSGVVGNKTGHDPADEKNNDQGSNPKEPSILGLHPQLNHQTPTTALHPLHHLHKKNAQRRRATYMNLPMFATKQKNNRPRKHSFRWGIFPTTCKSIDGSSF